MDIKKTFVIVSVSSRVDDLNNLLKTLEDHIFEFHDWDVSLLFQDNLGVADKIDKSKITHLYIEPKLMGCNMARIELLKRIKPFGYDIYCNLDDDIEVTEYTNYGPAILKCLDPTTGFVLTNWARTESLMMAKVPRMEDKFVKQALIYQGGGMLYNDIIADIVRKLPSVKTVFDEGWPLSAWLAGYENYRYLGSLAVHHICTTGGMNEFYKAVPDSELANLFPDYIEYQRGKDGKWLIPMDKDLTQKAKDVHAMNGRHLEVNELWRMRSNM